jgi:hypothetical protein
LALHQYITLSPGRSHQQDLATPTPSGPTAGSRVADCLGGWTRADPNSGGSSITWISVRKEDQRLVAQVRGRCPGPDCEWGTVSATVGRDVKSSAEAPINSIGDVLRPLSRTPGLVYAGHAAPSGVATRSAFSRNRGREIQLLERCQWHDRPVSGPSQSADLRREWSWDVVSRLS